MDPQVMSRLKKYPEVVLFEDKTKLYNFCGSLTPEEGAGWDIDHLSALLNKHFPSNAAHGSNHKVQWAAGRANIDVLLANKKPSLKRLMFNHPIIVTIIGTVVGGLILLAIQPFLKGSDTTTLKISPQQQIPESNQPKTNP